MKAGKAVGLVLPCGRERHPPFPTWSVQLRAVAAAVPSPGCARLLLKCKVTQPRLLKSCCFCDCSQLQTAAANPGLIFLLFGRMKSSLSGHS